MTIKKRGGEKAVAAGAAKVVVQLLFSTGKSFTVDGLREKLREWFREEARAELRATASLTNVQLVTALLEANELLVQAGLQLRIVHGVVSLMTTKIEGGKFANHLLEQTAQSGNPELTTATLEVLSCIAFKQPISQAQIDQIFAADKRSLVVKLRDLGLVEEFAGRDGRLRFVTTERFLNRFNLENTEQLREALREGSRKNPEDA